MPEHKLYLKDAQETVLCGTAIGQFCRVPMLIGLNGNLGAGKTSLAQGIGKGFGIDEHLSSPSFALIHEYQGKRGKLYHLDVYRLDSLDELFELDFESVLLEPQVLILVEWKNKFSDWPVELDCLEINLDHQPPGRQAHLHIPSSQAQLLEHLQPWQN